MKTKAFIRGDVGKGKWLEKCRLTYWMGWERKADRELEKKCQ